MTNYEMIKNFSIENMASIIMCPDEIELIDGKKERCIKHEDKYGNECQKCCYEWLQEESEG